MQDVSESTPPPPPNAPSSSTAAIQFDDDLGDANAKRIRETLAAGNFAQVDGYLAKLRHWDARSFYVLSAARWEGRPAWLDAWAEAMPQSPIARLVRGAHSVHWAWEGWHRAGAPEAAPAEFTERLTAADSDFAAAAQLDREDPTPYALMLRVSWAGGHHLGERQERYQALCQRDPNNRLGHSEMLRCMSLRWGGSHELMFQFADATDHRAPEGSSLHTIIAEAHVERWYMADRDGADRGYWQRPQVSGGIERAAQRSVESPHYNAGPMALVDRSWFAYCFAQIGDWTAARRQFQAMALPHRWPWGMFGDAAQLLLEARTNAMSRGERPTHLL